MNFLILVSSLNDPSLNERAVNVQEAYNISSEESFFIGEDQDFDFKNYEMQFSEDVCGDAHLHIVLRFNSETGTCGDQGLSIDALIGIIAKKMKCLTDLTLHMDSDDFMSEDDLRISFQDSLDTYGITCSYVFINPNEY